MPIQRSPGANVIATVDRIKAMMPVLQASIPSNIKINIVSDRTADHPRLGRRRAVHACC